MMNVSRAHCSMAPHAHGFGKGTYTKAIYRQNVSNSLIGSTTQVLLKARVFAAMSDFSVSLETEEGFMVAVCAILVWNSIKEAARNIISDKEMWLQVRVKRQLPC
jgi:hypothetical protein